MKRDFRPSVAVLEDRRMLSVTPNWHAAEAIALKAKQKEQPISGVLQGIFTLEAQPDAPDGPTLYGLGLLFRSGELNGLAMGGAVHVSVNSTSLVTPSIIWLAQYKGPARPPNRFEYSYKNSLQLTTFTLPFAPSYTVPTSFTLEARVRTAKGIFKRDVGEMLSVTVSTTTTDSNQSLVPLGFSSGVEEGGPITATFQPMND